MPSGWYADIQDAKALAKQLRGAKDERGAVIVERLISELAKFRNGEQPSEIAPEQPVTVGPAPDAKQLPPPPSESPHEG